MGLLGTAASLAMAFGAPLIYLDQALTISKQRDSTGFSSDIPALLIISNLTRCFFWLGERFEFPLLLQSILLIISMIYLQSLILKYHEGSLSNFRFTSSSGDDRNSNGGSRRRVVFDNQDENGNGNNDVGNVNRNNDNRDKRFNGDLPTFGVVVQPPSPTLENSNGNNNNNNNQKKINSKKSSKDSKGIYKSLKTSHSDDQTNLSNSSNQDQRQEDNDDDVDDEDEEEEETNLSTKIKNQSKKIFQNFTTFSGKGFLQFQNGRPFNFWKWKDFSSYLIFILLFILLQTILFLLLSSFENYITILGYIALGLESTLPIPQLISNQKRKSLSGFSVIVLGGWVLGDSFKTIYFIIRKSPLQFIVCSFFQLGIDCLICLQFWFFREKTQKEDEERKKIQEVLNSENGVGNVGVNGNDDWVEPSTSTSTSSNNSSNRLGTEKQNSNIGKLNETDPFVLEEEDDDDDEEEDDDWARNAWSKAGSSKNNSGIGEVEADESEEEDGRKGKANGKGKGRA